MEPVCDADKDEMDEMDERDCSESSGKVSGRQCLPLALQDLFGVMAMGRATSATSSGVYEVADCGMEI